MSNQSRKHVARQTPWTARLLLGVSALGLAVIPPAIAQTTRAPAAIATAGSITPLVEQIEIWPGAAHILIPVQVSWPAGREAVGGQLAPGVVRIDGEPAGAELVCIWLRREPGRAFASRWAAWWGNAAGAIWGAGDRAPTTEDVSPTWFLRLDVRVLAVDRTRLGEGRVEIGGARVTLRQLDAGLIKDGRELAERVVRERLEGQRAGGAEYSSLLNTLTPLASLPPERWRVALVARAIGEAPARLVVDGASQDGGAGVVGELCEQLEQRWFGALGRVSAADAATARVLTERLLQTVRFQGGWAAAWSAADRNEHQLCAELLKPERSRESLMRLAKEYVAALPGGAVWVVDDAAAAGEGGAGVARIGLVNLTSVPVIGSVSVGGGGLPLTQDVGGGGAVEVLVPIVSKAAIGGPVGAVNARVGVTATQLSVVTRAVPVTPPGMDIGPLVLDWSLETLVSGEVRTASRVRVPVGVEAAAPEEDDAPNDDPTEPRAKKRSTAATGLPQEDRKVSDASNSSESGAWLTTGRLYYVEDGAGERGSWMLYLEARQGDGPAAADAEGVRDEVRVYLGGMGSSSAALSVTPTGQLREVSKGRELGTVKIVRTAATEQRPATWAAWVPLPAGSVGADEVLRLGLERVDARGVRSAWPRPMLPWQREPGRIAVDTAAWLGLPK